MSNKRRRIWRIALLIVLAVFATTGSVIGWKLWQASGESAALVEAELLGRTFGSTAGDPNSDSLRDPINFDAFCQRVKRCNIEMRGRDERMSHTEIREEVVTNPQGTVVARERKVEKVQWQEDALQRTLIERTAEGSMLHFSGPPLVYPLSKFARVGDYTYHYDGREFVNGKDAARIRFSPAGKPAGLLAGWLWADSDSGQPIRFEGLAAQPPIGARRWRMVVEYAPCPAADSPNQIAVAQSTVEIPLLSQTRVTTVTYIEYQPIETNLINPTPVAPPAAVGRLSR